MFWPRWGPFLLGSHWTKEARIGEASNPGPNTLFHILSAGVTALQPHIKGKHNSLQRWLKELSPSALALQEVRLSKEAQ